MHLEEEVNTKENIKNKLSLKIKEIVNNYEEKIIENNN
jgi:hypothetical protein